jgi:hypothetical protein
VSSLLHTAGRGKLDETQQPRGSESGLPPSMRCESRRLQASGGFEDNGWLALNEEALNG